jgi:leader peptidase (prepilin peptidase)/N-methyltransferase
MNFTDPAALLAFPFGLVIGSFLNVCISRLPDDYSVVTPQSQCPRCGAAIAPYDNFPVFSFILLRARSRCCGSPISWRYPLVELLTGLAFYFVVAAVGVSWHAFKWCMFAALLIELIVSDLETRILPDEFTKSGIILGLLLAPIAPIPPGLVSVFTEGRSHAFTSFIDAAFTAVFLGGGMWLLGELYYRLRGREGLGFGDVKLVAMMGAFLGLESTMLALMMGSVFGLVLGMLWIRLRREDASSYELPFGSFLGLGAVLAAALQIT